MTTPQDSARTNPVLVEVLRGPLVESRHRGAAVITDHDGATRIAWGDVDRQVFPRSAVKPLQAIPMIESGAADAFGVSDAELALSCASHNGEALHVESASAWLHRIGLGPGDLECGAHWPLFQEATVALAANGGEPTALHNNCSGKHTGFLTLSRHLGWDPRGYVNPEHPVQGRITALLEEMYGIDLSPESLGVDGCSIPTWGVPLRILARAMARFARPDALGPVRAAAARRLAGAMMAHPFMVAGSDRFCTRVMSATPGRVVVKTGAEGVYVAALPGPGLGIAVKCDDGTTRASQVMMAALLHGLGVLDGAGAADLLTPAVHNVNGRAIGEIRPIGPLAAFAAGDP